MKSLIYYKILKNGKNKKISGSYEKNTFWKFGGSAQARAGADGLREAGRFFGAFYLHNPRGSPITGIGSFAKSPWRRRPKFCCFRSLRCRVRTLRNFHVRPPSSTRGTSRHIASTATDTACKVGLFHFTHMPPEMAKRTLNGNHHLGFTLCSLILVTLYFASISNVTHTTWTCYNSLITTDDEQYRLAVVNNTTDLATRKPIVCPLFIPYKSIKRSVVPRDCKQSRFCIIYFMLLLSGNIELNQDRLAYFLVGIANWTLAGISRE